MNREGLLRIIRAAAAMLGEDTVVIIGSQSILASFRDFTRAPQKLQGRAVEPFLSPSTSTAVRLIAASTKSPPGRKTRLAERHPAFAGIAQVVKRTQQQRNVER